MSERREYPANQQPLHPIIRLEYTCAARPPEYVDVRSLITFGRDNEGFYWESSGKKYHSEIGFIRMLFTPKKMTWEEAIRSVK